MEAYKIAVGVLVKMTKDDADRGYKVGEVYKVTDMAGLLSGHTIPAPSGYVNGVRVDGVGSQIELRLCDMRSPHDSQREALGEALAAAEEVAADIKAKTEYMDKYKLDMLDQRQYDIYKALGVVESKVEPFKKAEALARIFKQ
jgi:hypothetical protein